ncbi:MarR family transcriptional regulator [Pullulanibacillus sp. KACC 23026]|uniref:MarR family winged helix-turn-helix transcriptional regulator n=1 Tax=Pullulanibacillus sp. KACC 23026 TaxID=3028315 RepID=UPI0023AFDD70|nr:MarR family transcriptional regulator [Pullulanibacillus sp. KACC 23026]WEG14614.1 MarR family transcriptional regulator [Pullulanibacillus sp. KACC 23026]
MKQDDLIAGWLSLTTTYMNLAHELEEVMKREHDLTLKEFYVLLFLYETPEKKLRLQQLQQMVGLSQSAMSRLVARFEAKGCGALQREICQEDRRNIYTAITDIGEAKLAKARETFCSTIEAALGVKEIQEGLNALILTYAK